MVPIVKVCVPQFAGKISAPALGTCVSTIYVKRLRDTTTVVDYLRCAGRTSKTVPARLREVGF